MTSTVLICIFWLHADCRTFWLKLATFEAAGKICTRLPEAQTNQTIIDFNIFE